MSLIRLFKEKKSPEEIQALRNVRQLYYTFIAESTKAVLSSTKANMLTPETASEISKLLLKDKSWLQANPSVDVDDIGSRYDTLVSNIKDLLDNDKPKIAFKNGLKLYGIAIRAQNQQGLFTPAQYTKLKEILKEEEDWYTQNVTKATELDYLTEGQTLHDKILEVGLHPDTITDVKKETENKSQNDIEKTLLEKETKLKQKENNQVNLQKGAAIVTSTATSVFLNFIMIVLLILSGSFAANLAIGRAPIYRIFYFLYGVIPFFAPFVYAYVLYRRIRFGPIPIYAILPISIEPAVTRFGKYLWYPFYWVPDHQSVNAYSEFYTSLNTMVA
jgi:hypothetical protein